MFTDTSTPFHIDMARRKDGTILYCLVNEQTYEPVRCARPTTRLLPPQWLVTLRNQLNTEETQET